MRHDLTLTSLAGETVTLSVPTSWADVTLQQFVDWQCSDEPAVCCLAGITPEQLDRLSWGDAGYLMNLLAFAAELPDPPVSPGLRDVGEASYGQMVLTTQHLQAYPDKPLIYSAPYLYALYRSREVFGRYSEAQIVAMEQAIRATPVDQCLGNVLFTLGAWLLSMSVTPPDPHDATEPDDDELEAGLESLGDRFAVLLTADALAKSFGVPRKTLLDDYDADSCYSQLRLEQAKAAYQHRLAAIHRENRK